MQKMKHLVVALWAAAWMGYGAEGSIEVPLRTTDAGAADVGVDPRCPTGQLTCEGACVDPRSNALHCGACGRACASATPCSTGASGCSSSSMPSAPSRGRSMQA